MNSVEVFAALCEKAKDVAVASRISEASTRFALLDRDETINDKGTVIASLCQKAASFRVPKTQPADFSFGSVSDLKLDRSRSLESAELAVLAKSWSRITPDCFDIQATSKPSRDNAVRRKSLSEISTATFVSDADALSVRAVSDLGSSSNVTTESLTIDGLVAAICSDPRLLQALTKAVKSERNIRSSDINSNAKAHDVITALTAIKNGSQKTSASNQQIVPMRKARNLRKINKQSVQVKQSNSVISDAGSSCQNNSKVALESPSSVRQGFQLQSPQATMQASDGLSRRNTSEEGNSKDDPSDEALGTFGWKKAFDETSRRFYYYTADHTKVTWENPLVGR